MRARLLSGVMMFSLLALFLVRVEMVSRREAGETLPRFTGKMAEVRGRVVDDPDQRATSLHVTLVVVAINGAPGSGTLLALVPRESLVAYNDTVVVRGMLASPKTFVTDTGHEFDYPTYLRVRGISATMGRAALVSDTPGGPTLQGSLFLLKHVFERSLGRLFPEPENSLLGGVLLGERRGISKELTHAFVVSGLVHVVVLSGYNISIVSEGVFRLLSFLPRTLSIATGGGAMILFALLVGGGATTMRALIMAAVALLARYLHRSVVALRSLAFAGVVMVLWNPLLIYDPSFILSFLATFGLITLGPWVERHLMRVSFLQRERFAGVRSIIASTIAVQLFVLPVLLYFTGVFSLLSVPANVLALPVVPLAMFLGFIAGLLGLVSPVLAFVPMLGADLLLRWMIVVATAAASAPLGVFVVPQFSAWLVLGAYIPLTWFAVGKYRASNERL